MNLLTLLLQSGIVQAKILPQVQKFGTWATRQLAGKTEGDKDLAANSSLVSAVEGAAANSLTQVAVQKIGLQHLAGDKLAGQLGIPTTEQDLAAAAGAVISGQSTLNLSDQNALTSFLESNLIR